MKPDATHTTDATFTINAGAFLAATRDMPPAQTGMLVRIVALLAASGALPNEPDFVMRLAGQTPEEWSVPGGGAPLRFFCLSPDGRLRLSPEYAHAFGLPAPLVERWSWQEAGAPDGARIPAQKPAAAA